jgi:pimeloyl-ACP methyl ester carboxylesterase
VRLYFEETGSGSPIIFVHEFAGDHRSWEAQLRHLGRRYRAITYAARGYPPSDVPEDPASYSQNRAADDILAVLDHLGIRQASMRIYHLPPFQIYSKTNPEDLIGPAHLAISPVTNWAR